MLLLFNKTTNTTEPQYNDSYSYLFCSSIKNSDEYLLTENISIDNISFDSKIKLKNNIVNTISFTISKKFNNERETEYLTDAIHANYNIYIGENGLSKYSITPTYSYIDNVGKTVIFLEEQAINEKTLPLAMLEGKIYDNLDIESIKNSYESNNYSCEIRNYEK